MMDIADIKMGKSPGEFILIAEGGGEVHHIPSAPWEELKFINEITIVKEVDVIRPTLLGLFGKRVNASEVKQYEGYNYYATAEFMALQSSGAVGGPGDYAKAYANGYIHTYDDIAWELVDYTNPRSGTGIPEIDKMTVYKKVHTAQSRTFEVYRDIHGQAN